MSETVTLMGLAVGAGGLGVAALKLLLDHKSRTGAIRHEMYKENLKLYLDTAEALREAVEMFPAKWPFDKDCPTETIAKAMRSPDWPYTDAEREGIRESMSGWVRRTAGLFARLYVVAPKQVIDAVNDFHKSIDRITDGEPKGGRDGYLAQRMPLMLVVNSLIATLEVLRHASGAARLTKDVHAMLGIDLGDLPEPVARVGQEGKGLKAEGKPRRTE
jgi:hypothetical protein